MSPYIYEHARHEPARRVLRWLITNIGWRWLGKLDRVEGLEHLPPTGPAIVMMNHIAFVDPIVVLGTLPRNVVPLAKIEVYRLPVWSWFTKWWDVIPVRRDSADRVALERMLAVLRAGEVLLIAPEGTRGPALRPAKTGLAYLAYKTQAPIVPVALEHTAGFPTLSRKRWREPGAVVRLGPPFRFKPLPQRPSPETLRQMTDEAMYRLAAMLPESRRGVYADLSRATSVYIAASGPGE